MTALLTREEAAQVTCPIDGARWRIIQGDCRATMASMPAESVDSIVTDPPYGLSFMGKGWDHGVPGEEFWREALRVAKPGAHLLAFGGTRTFHRLTCAIEDAGWEVRDCIMWVYGSGFPKSLDVSKAIDKAAGAERDVVGTGKGRTGRAAQPNGTSFSDDAYRWPGEFQVTAPATEAARQWSGWGTALKPAWEPIIVARKPIQGTVAANVLEHGTGALNVDGCRVDGGKRPLIERAHQYRPENFDIPSGSRHAGTTMTGRWPANFVHDGSPEVLAGFPQARAYCSNPETAAAASGRTFVNGSRNAYDLQKAEGLAFTRGQMYADSGSAARFYYCAKASKADRDEGLEGMPVASAGERSGRTDGSAGITPYAGTSSPGRNVHPTVKPTDLMRWLLRLVTPPAGLVLDPFCGSGSTGKAALLEGFRFAGCELEAEYVAIAQARLSAVGEVQPSLFEAAS